MNLAVADIIYSTFLVPELIFSHIFTHPEALTVRVLCILRNGTLSWIDGNSSLVTLVAIAVERYYAVIYPLGNKGKLTTGKLKVCHWANALSLKVSSQYICKCFQVVRKREETQISSHHNFNRRLTSIYDSNARARIQFFGIQL